MKKQYKKINEQIEIFRQKGLEFKNEEEAKNIILRENFYNLTEGYEDVFLNFKKSTTTNTEVYEEETYFEELYAIYKIDRELKNIIFDYINIVESNIKSYIYYVFSERYEDEDFFKRENFRDEIKFDKKFETLKEQVNINLQRNKKIDKNNKIPIWILIKAFTFGNMATFYSLINLEEKQRVAQNLRISPYSLEKYLYMLNVVRNISAHGDILFNLRLNMHIDNKDYNYHEYLKIPKDKDGNYICGTNDLFAVIIILKKILTPKDFYRLFAQIENLLREIKEEIDDLSFQNLMNTMGFPTNYVLLKMC